MRFFDYFTLFVACIISACAAYYSIVGLTAIFAGAFWPIVIMGTVLEAGKLTGAVWLHLNWHYATWWIRAYMVPAVAILMVITSMGIFGFLSRAHIEQTAGADNVVTQVEQLNLDIATQQMVIDNNRKLLGQLDAAINSLLSASGTQSSGKNIGNADAAQRTAEAATRLRKQQQKERDSLNAEIKIANDKVVELNKQKLVLEQKVKKIETEVGPIKYVAALIYGDNPDTNTLERAVRWMIILLVVVFDPLAVVMILAATSGLGGIRRTSMDPVNGFFERGKEIARALDQKAKDLLAKESAEEEDPKKKLATNQKESAISPKQSPRLSASPRKRSSTATKSRGSRSRLK